MLLSLANTSTGLKPQRSFDSIQTRVLGIKDSDSVYDREVFVLRGRQRVEGRGQDRPSTHLLVPRDQHFHSDRQPLGHRRAHSLLWEISNGTGHWVTNCYSKTY